jgi:type I restriction enzyme, S subunit
MTAAWPKVKLGEVLRHRKEFITIDELTNYRRPRVQLHAQGIVLRDEVPGSLIKTKKQQVCQAGEFLVAEIDAKVGGFGIVPDFLNGSIVSSHYFLFVADGTKLDRRFLDYFIRTPAFREQVEAQGSTNYAAIRPAHVLAYEIPLPPLSEQRRIVGRIEELAAEIESARKLRAEAVEEAQALKRKTLDALLATDRTPRMPLLELLSEPLMNGLSVPASRLGSGNCFAKVGVVNTGEFDSRETKLVDVNLAPNSPYWLRKDDIVVSRGNCPEFVGRAAIYRGEPARCAIPDLLIRVRLDAKKADVRFVSAFFHSSEAREYIASQISGTSSTMPKISQAKLEALPIPVPQLPEQRRIVAELDALQTDVDALKAAQTETAAELDALLPSILDRAFKGELVLASFPFAVSTTP